MNLPSLLLVALLGLPPAPQPTVLVERLGSPRYAERERAAADLLALGPDALEALRAARRARDAEVRVRVTTLLDRIESDLMVRPTMVALDFKNRPLTEVVKAIGQRTRINLTLQPDNEDFWKGRLVTLEESAPVPFWTAVDRLCGAGQLQHNPNFGQPSGQPPALHLMGGGPTGGPTCDNGPFRAQLTSLNHHRDLNFNGFQAPQAAGQVGRKPRAPRLEEVANDQFYFQLQVMAEPRLLLGQGGQLKLTEALDDLGQSLLLPTPGDQSTHVVHYNGFYYGGAAQTVQMQGHLKYPAKPGKRIKSLRGAVPVAIAVRKPDPLTVSLGGVAGKTFRSDEATIIFHELKADPNGQGPLLEITVRDNGGSAPRSDVPVFQPMHNPQSQIEILDAQGRALAFYPRQTSGRPGDARMVLSLMNNGEVGPPTQLKYYDLVRASAEATFEFHDLPMP